MVVDLAGAVVAVDTGGTFTDVVVAPKEDIALVAKSLTNPRRPFQAIADALDLIAARVGADPQSILQEASAFVYGTTRSTNAIVERAVSKTALLTTAGFPDILRLKEGGRPDPHRFTEYPDPYVPSNLTFEIDERVSASGEIIRPLDVDTVHLAVESIEAAGCESVGVSLLWSIINPAHEILVGEILEEKIPGIAVTLSHRLLPIIREYRRTSATVIDASIKPLMGKHLQSLAEALTDAGFQGPILAMTSAGSTWPIDEVAERPVYSVGSGPALAPVAAVAYTAAEFGLDGADGEIIICDAGGTTFDISIAVGGRTQTTKEAWVGDRYSGDILGIKAADIRSVGAGGGSIIWVDSGGMLRVGPQSAGSEPGPACYGLGGTRPTITDAAVRLGYIHPTRKLGEQVEVHPDLADRALSGLPTGQGSTVESSAAAVGIAASVCASAIRELTISQGIDPRDKVLVAGGGAAGLFIVETARDLGARRVLIPNTAGVLSAMGGVHSDLHSEFSATCYTETRDLDFHAINSILGALKKEADEFLERISRNLEVEVSTTYSVEARYPGQIWELEVPLSAGSLSTNDVVQLEERFHEAHERRFAISERGQYLECVSWFATATAVPSKPAIRSRIAQTEKPEIGSTDCYFHDTGWVRTPRFNGSAMRPGTVVSGPAIVEEPTTTVVVDTRSRLTVTGLNNYVLELWE